MTIQVGEKEYKFEITMKSLDLIEDTMGTSLIDALQKANGAIKVKDAKTILAHSLYGEEGGKIPYVQSYKIAEEYILEKGYQESLVNVVEQVQKDLPFLFR